VLTCADPPQSEGADPIVRTEAVKYDPYSLKSSQPISAATPLVTAESRKVVMREGGVEAEGEELSSRKVSSTQKTIETVTFTTEKDGVVETRVQQNITIQSEGEPGIDHDAALREAIQEATDVNPDITVDKIEIRQLSPLR